jgi:hypothetical protein
MADEQKQREAWRKTVTRCRRPSLRREASAYGIRTPHTIHAAAQKTVICQLEAIAARLNAQRLLAKRL